MTWNFYFTSRVDRRSVVPRFNLRKGNFMDFAEILKDNTVLNLNDLSSSYESLIQAYRAAQEKCIPLISPSNHNYKRGPKWLTKDTKRATTMKYKLHCRLRACSSNFRAQLKIEYKAAAKLVKDIVLSSRSKFEANIASTCASTKNLKPLYNYINSQKTSRDIIRSLKDKEGVTTSDGQAIVNILNNQFCEVFNPKDPGTTAKLDRKTVNCCSLNPNVFSTFNITKAIEMMNTNKSSGSDGIHPFVVHNCVNSFAQLLSNFFKASFSTGILPRQWKECNITPIFKKGDRIDPSNYRPISLTAIPCKIMERIVRDVMIDHLTVNNLIASQQHGFVRSKSCLTNLLETIDVVTDSLNHGYSVNIIFLDFAKAFDKVCHESLLIKLEAYGFDLPLRNWVRGLLSNRKQRVVIGNNSSS